MKHAAIILLTTLTLTACEGYKTPTISSDPTKMSGNTLCYRHATRPNNEKLATEIRARRLNCNAILENDPLYTGQNTSH